MQTWGRAQKFINNFLYLFPKHFPPHILHCNSWFLLGLSLECETKSWGFVYFALLCTPKTAPACGAKQNKYREIKKEKKLCWNFTNSFGNTFHWRKRKAPIPQNFGSSDFHCCQLLKEWSKENRGKKTIERKQNEHSLRVRGSLCIPWARTTGFLLELCLLVPQWPLLVHWVQVRRYQKREKMLNSLPLWLYFELRPLPLFCLLCLLVRVLSIY